MNTIQRMISDIVLDPLWQEHNKNKHWKDNKYNKTDDEHLSARIVWYVEHRHEMVDHHDQFLMEIDLTRLSGMRREMKRKWIYHLNIARRAWEIEREQKNKHQQVITRFFGRRDILGGNMMHR